MASRTAIGTEADVGTPPPDVAVNTPPPAQRHGDGAPVPAAEVVSEAFLFC